MTNDEYSISTGVGSLDRLLGGGIHAGMHVILSGETGSGVSELVRTMMISMLSDSNASSDEKMFQPSVVGYVTATKSLYEIQSEIYKLSPGTHMENIKFLDLSPATFLGSSVPQRWVLEDEQRLNEIAMIGREELIQELIIQFLETLPPGSVVFLDFVTELSSMSRVVGWDDLLLLLYGIRRLAHNQNHVICTLTNRVALGSERAEQISNTADGILNFEWEEITAYQRQRIMFIQDWPGLTFTQEEGSTMKFAISYSPRTGFEVSTVRQIMGR